MPWYTVRTVSVKYPDFKHSMKNTLEKGRVRSVIFWDTDDRTWYAAALEFNLVESGDTPNEAMEMLTGAMKAYLSAIRKEKLPLKFLNQKPFPEYEKLWKQSQSQKPVKRINHTIFSSSFISLPSLFAMA